MAGELGKASLDLEANLGPFERNVTAADATSDRLKDTLEALAAVANAAESALNDVKMGAGSATRSRISAEEIISGVHGITEEARDAAREIDRVHLSETQAAETEAAGAGIDSVLNRISRKAREARRDLFSVRLAGGRNGVGVGPFGSGFGRVGARGAAIGVGALTAPAAGPAAVGLLAGIPTMAAAGAGALGTLALAFSGVGKAIAGDKKAFDDLTASQKQFVLTVRSLDGLFDRLKQIAGQSLFPGLTKGLKAALSPGTVNAIETALVQLGHALGGAGAAWGKYFGSPRFQQIFGPLMQSAARNIGVLSDAFLHLFDAFGVLARAAIPFTNWLNTAIDRGVKFADTWLRARDATGQLGSAMREAQTSLKLVGGLALSLVRVVVALGAALYPVAKVAVKDLTDGLNAVATVIEQNKNGIRDFVRGALDALVAAVKIAWPIVFALAKALSAVVRAIGGWKTAFAIIISGFLAVKFATLGKSIYGVGKSIYAVGKAIATIGSAAVVAEGEAVPAITAIGLAASAAATGGIAVLTAGLVAAYIIVQKLTAALGSLPTDKQAVAGLSAKWRKRHPKLTAEYEKYLYEQGQFDPSTGKFVPQPGHHALTFMQWLQKHHPKSVPGSNTPNSSNPKGPKPGTHDWYMKYLGYDPTQQPTFGPPPPFTKNTGSGSGRPSVIPATVEHLIALASQQASIAANAKSLKKEQTALNKEITDLEKADKILHEKWRNAHGKAKTALFNEITTVENRIRSARKKLRDAVAKGGGSAKLDYALEQAKVAVENAKEGSKAWDTAVNAEEKALKDEIRYWDKRAHNDKLSRDARTAALKKELVYQKQLKALLAPIKAAASANIAQFLQTFGDIQNTFAPNAVPFGPQPSSGKTDTHLHEIKNEARQTNKHLKAMRDRHRFRHSHHSHDAAMAVG